MDTSKPAVIVNPRSGGGLSERTWAALVGPLTGHVRLISPQIDPQTKLGEVRILLPVRDDIRAGGFGRAVFADASGQALAAPETAIRYDADGASVMTVDSRNRVKRATVQTGARGGGWVQLVKGPPAEMAFSTACREGLFAIQSSGR